MVVEYRDGTPFAGDNHTPTELANAIRTKKYGKDVREPIAQLADKLSNVVLGQNVGNVVAAPTKVFDNLAELQKTYPNGADGVMVTVDNGHKYFWQNNQWKDFGIYQSAGMSDAKISEFHNPRSYPGEYTMISNMTISGIYFVWEHTDDEPVPFSGTGVIEIMANAPSPTAIIQRLTDTVEQKTWVRYIDTGSKPKISEWKLQGYEYYSIYNFKYEYKKLSDVRKLGEYSLRDDDHLVTDAPVNSNIIGYLKVNKGGSDTAIVQEFTQTTTQRRWIRYIDTNFIGSWVEIITSSTLPKELSILNRKKILTIGDSMIDTNSVETQRHWAQMIADDNNAILVNKAVSGSFVTGGILESVKKVDVGTNPDYIFIHAGTNDINKISEDLGSKDTISDESTFYGAYYSMLSILINKFPKAKIAIFTPHLVYDRTDRALQARNIIDEICNAFLIPYYDNTKDIGILPYSNSRKNPLYYNYLHLNSDGNDFVKNRYESFIKSL